MFLHIDIDCFFVSAERSIAPELKGIPVAVGGRSNLDIFDRKPVHIRLIDENSGAFVAPVFYAGKKESFDSFFVDRVGDVKKIRGIITTSSYEARSFGVKTAMPVAQALKICPQLIVVPPKYMLYHRLSHQIYLFIQKKIPQVEQYSIDEFFGDVNGWIDDKDAYMFAMDLQEELLELFDIPVSIGISRAKWIAKLATSSAKPFGVYEVKNIDAFIEDIPIEEFPGIGRSFKKRLRSYNIYKLGEIKQRKMLFYSWKKPGIQLYHRIMGSDHESISRRAERKSIGISRTFDKISDSGEIRRRIMIMARNVVYMATAINANPTKYYLKINYEYGIKVKQSKRVERIFSETLFKSVLSQMYDEIVRVGAGAIKISIAVSDFISNNPRTLSMLDLNEDIKQSRLTKYMQKLRDRFGLDIIKSGSEF